MRKAIVIGKRIHLLTNDSVSLTFSAQTGNRQLATGNNIIMVNPFNEEYFMGEALKEAQKAFEIGEVPVGAVVVCKNRVIARAHNQTEKLTDATAHAEMLAVTAAANYLGSKYLTECTLYVTLEPCVMCAGALHWVQLQKLVFGASDIQRGYSLVSTPLLHAKTEVVKGIKATEAKALIDNFFKQIRL